MQSKVHAPIALLKANLHRKSFVAVVYNKKLEKIPRALLNLCRKSSSIATYFTEPILSNSDLLVLFLLNLVIN